MDHIWVLSYAHVALECWYFSTEEKAKEAMKALLPGRIDFHFCISKRPFDSIDGKVEFGDWPVC